MASSTFWLASFDRGHDQVLQHFNIARFHDLGIDDEAEQLLLRRSCSP